MLDKTDTKLRVTKTGQLPRGMQDRDSYIGVKITRNPTTKYLSARFTISKTMYDLIGKPKRITIRGTPENGYIITKGEELTPSSPTDAGHSVYINSNIDRVNLPNTERGSVWVRGEVEEKGKRIRVPSLPPAWIAGDAEFMPGATVEETERHMRLGKAIGDDAVRDGPSGSKVNGNGHAAPNGNGNGGLHGTSPVPKQAINYQLPDNLSMSDAQVLLSHKLDEARAIIRELEKRTGMRFTLSRALTLVVDLNAQR